MVAGGDTGEGAGLGLKESAFRCAAQHFGRRSRYGRAGWDWRVVLGDLWPRPVGGGAEVLLRA